MKKVRESASVCIEWVVGTKLCWGKNFWLGVTRSFIGLYTLTQNGHHRIRSAFLKTRNINVQKPLNHHSMWWVIAQFSNPIQSNLYYLFAVFKINCVHCWTILSRQWSTMTSKSVFTPNAASISWKKFGQVKSYFLKLFRGQILTCPSSASALHTVSLFRNSFWEIFPCLCEILKKRSDRLKSKILI